MSETVTIKIPFEKGKRLKAFISVANGLFNLTNKEKEVVEAIMNVDSPHPITSKTRPIIAKTVGYKDVRVLNASIGKLKTKGAIVENETTGLYKLNPLLEAWKSDKLLFKLEEKKDG